MEKDQPETQEPQIVTIEEKQPQVATEARKMPEIKCDFSTANQFLKMPVHETMPNGNIRIKAFFEDPLKYVGGLYSFGGWAKTTRKAKDKKEVDGVETTQRLLFVELSDGTCQDTLQVVVNESIGSELMDKLEKNTSVATSWQFRGTVIKSGHDKQLAELQVAEPVKHLAVVIGANMAPGKYPIQKKAHKLETIRQFPHLRMRSNILGASFRLRNALSMATHLFFQSMGFLYIHTPLITCSDCEGAGEMFSVTTMLKQDTDITTLPQKKKKKNQIDFSKDFFERQAFLTVSGQLNVEPYCCSMSNVYTFGPTFRAEQSFTTRHLAEFWMIEPELAFAGMTENMHCAEQYMKFCITYCLTNCMDDIELCSKAMDKEKCGGDLIKYLADIANSDFRKMEYTEAIKILEEAIANGKTFEIPVVWGMDLKSEHERFLCEVIVKGPLFLYNYPKDIKPFYMKVNEDDKTVGAMDL